MIRFGKEEPIQENGSLFEWDSIENRIFSAKKKKSHLNRYSLIGDGSELLDNCNVFLGSILEQFDTKIYLLSSWKVFLTTRSSLASRIRKSNFEKNGWYVGLKDEEHYLSIKELDVNNQLSASTTIDMLRGYDFFFILSNSAQIEVFNQVNHEQSFFLARNGYFVPETKFLHAMEIEELSVIYPVSDNNGNLGFVMLSKCRLNAMIFSKKIHLSEIFENSEAYKVFL